MKKAFLIIGLMFLLFLIYFGAALLILMNPNLIGLGFFIMLFAGPLCAFLYELIVDRI